MSIMIPVPPIDEQDYIVTEIEILTSSVRSAVLLNRHEMGLVQEYRTRLISDVVTGKLDVRGVELPALEEFVYAGIESVTADVDDDTSEVLDEE